MNVQCSDLARNIVQKCRDFSALKLLHWVNEWILFRIDESIVNYDLSWKYLTLYRNEMLRIASIITINVHCTSNLTNLNFKLFKEISEIKKLVLYRFRIGLLFFHSVFSSGWYHQIIISSITINPSSETISTIDKTEIYAPASSGWHLGYAFPRLPLEYQGM